MSRVETNRPLLTELGFSGYVEDAHPNYVTKVIAADPESDDGRSQWLWITLPNGDKLIACYPQGDTYSESEIYQSN